MPAVVRVRQPDVNAGAVTLVFAALTGLGTLPAAAIACSVTLVLPLAGRNYYSLACRYPGVIAARQAAG